MRVFESDDYQWYPEQGGYEFYLAVNKPGDPDSDCADITVTASENGINISIRATATNVVTDTSLTWDDIGVAYKE